MKIKKSLKSRKTQQQRTVLSFYLNNNQTQGNGIEIPAERKKTVGEEIN